MVDAGAQIRRPPRRARRRSSASGPWSCRWTEWQRPTTRFTGVPSYVAQHEHRHRVGVVEQPGVGAELGHVGGDALHHRDGAQRAEDAADAQRVADRLPQAVPARDLEVDQRGGIAADLDHVDHVIDAVERGSPVEVRLHCRRRPQLPAVQRAIASAASSRSGSMSCSAMVASASSGKVRMSPSRLRVNSTLPAPMKAIRGHARKCFRSDRNDQECSQPPSSGRSTSCPPPAAGWVCWPPTSAPSWSPRWSAPGCPVDADAMRSSSSTWCGPGRRAPAMLLDPEIALPHVLDERSLPARTGLLVSLERSGSRRAPTGACGEPSCCPGWAPRSPPCRRYRGQAAAAPARRSRGRRRPQRALLRAAAADCAAHHLLLVVEVLVYRLDDESDGRFAARRAELIRDGALLAEAAGARYLKLEFPGTRRPAGG